MLYMKFTLSAVSSQQTLRGCFIALCQASVGYELWAKSGPRSAFINKVLLGHSCIHSFVHGYAITCMQVRKQQLELDIEQQTGSKYEKEYVKAVYCHPAYLTYMQSTS